MKILILTASFGMGHNKASIALKEEILKNNSKTDVVIVDIMNYIMPKISKYIYKTFNVFVSNYKLSCVYNLFYGVLDKNNNKIAFYENFIYSKFNELIASTSPDYIISTIPIASNIVSKYQHKSGVKIPLITCITDVTAHNEWISSATTAYMVPHINIKKELIEKGIDENQIYISGIPVRNNFKISHYEKKITNQSELLIMGGGLGILPYTESFLKNLNETKDIKVTIITGNNLNAYNKLHNKYKNFNVLGYTDNIHEYMQKADIIVTKPGGITLFECIHSSLPLFVIHPFLAQEISNANFIEQKGLGHIMWNEEENHYAHLIKLLNDKSTIAEFKTNMSLLKKDFMNQNITSILEALKLRRAS